MTILVADDDPVTLESLAACLQPEGFRTLLARDGAEALALWQKQKPDLLCLDIMMPGMDGYEVCRRVRAVDAGVPILFLSAKSEEIDVVVGLRLGADDFVRKPFGKHELIARIGTALRRRQVQQPAVDSFQMGPLRIVPAELRAQRGEASLDLTPREVSILKLLHERAGQVLSRDVLLDVCWGLDYMPESRTLDQHIAKLRKKIEREPEEIIETVRGVGYRWRGQG
ncbi:MAG: response regulator transcription factor [Prosthecobacter sp.]|jgi:two-component system alkaline phosphatase synthesis response regulator PhoP|uniref:response regulator transcription factor n=1 Tax=Prosthecobacter sp. TaxID=1965333 RepID=UPI001A0282CA|nr:response regulator transcription factor [Prosthecobacter sp.]MBE2287586.1 response regulator transcription factor [Prosthecobacter sp.]